MHVNYVFYYNVQQNYPIKEMIMGLSGAGPEIGRAILFFASPFAATTTGAHVIESRSKNALIAGLFQVVQAAPVVWYITATLCDKINHAIFWRGISFAHYSTSNESIEALKWWDSVGNVKIREVRADFWAPKLSLAIGLTLLVIPILTKGLQLLAEKNHWTNASKFLDYFNKIYTTVVKITNIGLLTLGFLMACALSNPTLPILYFSMLAINIGILIYQGFSLFVGINALSESGKKT